MKQLSSSEIRQMYLDFFKSKGHWIEPSASLIPVNDPSLLWINSGVATMKQYFNGSIVPKSLRLTSSQKSIRTNDIENVGKTARHHTLFEMLGNFSVGDYFKEEAIKFAWELLTTDKWFGWDPNRLYMTVYYKDNDAKKFWHQVGVSEDHIIESEDNFWDIGEGPSGPDTEIFYDRGEEFSTLSVDDSENYPGGENERWLEIWNIVFSQYNHELDGSYSSLPRKNIDTGMGLERVVSIFQHAKTNFETDLFLPMIHKTEEISGKKYNVNPILDIYFKVISDHVRAITFAISDGSLPSNEGRGYVIRRLIRRAVINGQKLGINGKFLYKLVPVVGETMKVYYPEVLNNSEYISVVVKSEEQRFTETITDGMTLLNELIANTKKYKKEKIDGVESFKLYDTYGLPIEITREYAADEGITVDEDGFDDEMKKQRDRSRSSRTDKNAMGVQSNILVNVKTPSDYVGYTQLHVDAAQITNIISSYELVDHADKGSVQVFFDITPFYAEMGGQVADKGTVTTKNGQLIAEVIDVQHAPNGQNIHTLLLAAPIKVGDEVVLNVDRQFHSKVEKNHTATHLLDQALRNVFGNHTKQAGSLVASNYLRFDFTHVGQVTEKEINKLEAIVNEKIFAELPITTLETDPDTGNKMGAVALFSEKYGDVVRVVSIGDFSIEFCGGTHVSNTNTIGLFKIKSETGIGAGIRRIEAVTSADAYKYLNDRDNLFKTVATTLRVQQVTDVPNRVFQLQSQIKKLTSTTESLEIKLISTKAKQIFKNIDTINGKTLISGIVEDSTMDSLRQLADTWRQKNLSDVLAIGTKMGKTANLLVATNDNAIKHGIVADDLIKNIAPKIGGGGGGRSNLAQAGGNNPDGLSNAMTAITQWLKNKV